MKIRKNDEKKQENETKVEEKQFMKLDMQSLCILFQTQNRIENFFFIFMRKR